MKNKLTAVRVLTKPTASTRLALPIISIALFSSQVFAQLPSSVEKNDQLEEVVINAHPLHENGLSQSVNILRGEELTDVLASNLGDTLATQPGIRSASFGAASGRPIIHGLGGTRVKTTQDNIDSLDVSVTSTDHAVTVEPFIANQITVLKGASTLLYGSGAIGGVVDVETGRIPTQLNEENFSGRGQVQLSDNNNGETGALRLDGNLTDNLAWHIDGFSKQADDYDIPGFAESANYMAAEHDEDHDDDEHHEEENDAHEGEEEFGILEGSRFDIQGVAGGLSWVDGENHLGISISGLDGSYGLVGGHAHEDEHAEEHNDDHDDHEEHDEEDHHDEHSEEHSEEDAPGRIDLKQTRVDISGKFTSTHDLINAYNFRIGVNNYQHAEVEGNGEIGSFFENDAWEARLFANHNEISGFKGVIGLQLSDRDFSAIGEEAFVPPSNSETLALFWVGEREYEHFSLELGARIESLDTKTTINDENVNRSFTTFSSSIGAVMPISERSTLTALIDYAERAPSIEELFSNGPHLATQTFEIGNIGLEKENSTNLTLAYGFETDALDAHITLYHYQFDNYIFQESFGLEEDGLPVLNYQQNDADFTGMDVELGIHLFEINKADIDLRFSYDLVEADLNTQALQNLPRIPANRFSADLLWHTPLWRAKLSFSDVSDQNDSAPFELSTEGYQDISAKIERQFDMGTTRITAFINGKNLTDEEQRNHTSFVKDVAPAPGRTVEAGIRFAF